VTELHLKVIERHIKAIERHIKVIDRRVDPSAARHQNRDQAVA
jgi:hypothetical protein